MKERIREIMDEVLAHRRYLHAHPEPSHQERETATYIAAELRKLGLNPRENVGGYGVTAVIEGKGSGRCVALRADFDALEITETTGVPFASQNPGVMHACGHDTHTAMLLGAAKVLTELREQFSGRVKLIFQPAEEDAANSGAKAMIADGCLDGVDAIFAQHIWPDFPLGTFAVRDGAMHAASDRFFITVHGKSSHGGASPQQGVDAIVIAAYIIAALQTIVSRNVGPLQSSVVSIGTIHGGSRYNIVADSVKLEGTCRNLDVAMRASMAERITKIARGVAEGMGGSCDVDYRYCYGVTGNTPETFAMMCDTIRERFGDAALIVPESGGLGGEDFSYYCAEIPGGFAWLGCHEEGSEPMSLHSSSFLPPEETLRYGVEFLVNTALRYLRVV